jgi:hypothetical protein
MRVLILGGTRYFGKAAVELLLRNIRFTSPLHQGSLNKSSTEQFSLFAIFKARTVEGT